MSQTAKVIAITGKGGVGKSTLAALVIRRLKETASGAVLALDADPDANLATLLGVPVESTIGDLREEVLHAIRDFPPGMSKDNYIEAGLHQIIAESDRLDVITMGRGEGPGCYCYINNILRKFADDLMPSYEWVVMDNEAGMEHLSRRTAGRIDDLIVVVSENPLSLDCARRIDRLVGEIGREVGRRWFVLNAVRAGRADSVVEKLADAQLEYLGAVPRDEAIEEAVFSGRSLLEIPDGPAVRAVNACMDKIGAE